MSYKLTGEGETVSFDAVHYVFVEKRGEFMETAPACWNEIVPQLPAIKAKNEVTKYFALYKTAPEKIYSAGVGVSEEPKDLPAGVEHKLFKGGKYAQFVMTGAYKHLPQACGKVFEIVKERNLKVRDDWYIEDYLNDPRSTPEDELITHILVPLE